MQSSDHGSGVGCHPGQGRWFAFVKFRCYRFVGSGLSALRELMEKRGGNALEDSCCITCCLARGAALALRNIFMV